MGQQLAKQMQSALLTQDNQHRDQLVKEFVKILSENLDDETEGLENKTAAIISAFKRELKVSIDNSKCQEELLPPQLFHSSESKTLPTQRSESSLSIFESQISFLTQTSQKICSTIVEIMSTRKLYHIRQSFRRLSLQVLNLENAEFYVFHDSGKVEYHDFNENYITQLLQNDQKRKVIQYVLANAAEMVENVEMSGWNGKKEIKKQQSQSKIPMEKRVSFCQQPQLFMKLFTPPTDPKLSSYGQINKQNQKYSILSMFTFNKENPHSFQQINPKIVHNLVKISMIQIQEETEYDIIKFYCKELLDVLGLIIGDSEARVKKLLKAEREKLVGNKTESEEGKSTLNEKVLIDDKLSLIETVKRSFLQQPTLLQSLMPSALKYQQYRYQLLQRQRMYSKYLCQDNVIFMDFDEQGELYFLSNNRKDSEYEALLNELKLNDELCIEKIFKENVPLQEHIRKSLDDEVKNKKLYDLENGLKARVIRNQVDEIQRIMVLVEDPPIILNQGILSSSTLQGASSSKKNQKKKKHGSSGSDNVSLGKMSRGSANLIRNLEKQNPGATDNGWLTLFIKDHELKRNNSTVMSKKKGTLFAKGEEGPRSLKVISPSLNFQEIEFLQQQDINSPDTNLITFKIEYLEPFVKKVFKSMSFFNSLEYNKEHFDNFLFHLHEGYQLHDNSFHNFTHGVNVMHTCFLICGIEGNAEVISPLKVFSTVFSGLCHDVGHTGRTNSFEIASRSKKAITYNDLSPLENFHVSYACEILRRPENNFLQSLSFEEYNEIRKDMISNILYTDIKEHFPLIKKFKAIEYKPKEKILSAEDLRILTGMIVHTSDFGGSAKEFEICAEWSRRVNLEFIAQYQQEEELGIPQTPFFKDLQVESIMAKNEMGFLKVIVFPLYEALDDFYKDQGVLHKLRIYAENNIKEWQKVHINSSAIKSEDKKEPKEEEKKQHQN